MKKYLLPTSVIIASLLLSLTKFYSLGYILMIFMAAATLPSFFIFRTAIQRFVLVFFIFLAITPLVGLVCWICKIEDYPILNLLGFMGFLWFLPKTLFQNTEKVSAPLSDKSDLVAIALAIVPLFIIGLSFFSSPSKPAALFQLASEGWDNGSHVLMMEDNSSFNGYVYGPHEALKNKIVEAFNAYPQAWHLTSSNFMNGFGGNRFNPHTPVATIANYMIVSFTWMILASYLFTLCAWRFYEFITKKSIKDITEIAPIMAVSFLVQMIVIYGSLVSGFTNYIGSIAYLILLAAIVIELAKKQHSRLYILAILFGTVSVLTWFLTFPPIAFTILLILLLRNRSIKMSVVDTLKDWRFILFALFGFVAMILQIYIFQAFSSKGGSDQLNTGVRIDAFHAVVGVFPVNQLLYGVIIGACLFFCFAKKTSSMLQKVILTIVVPWLLLAFGVFVYQNITVGYTSYYLSKVLGLSLIAGGIICSALFAVWLKKYAADNHSKILIPVASVLVIGIAVIGTGQSTYGLNKLFQGNARTSYETAVEIVSLLDTTTSGKNYIVVLRGHLLQDGSLEDYHGKLEMRAVHQPFNCAYYITGHRPLGKELDRLATCADKLAKDGKTITVITSNFTENKVDALHRKNIIIKSLP